PLARVEFQPTRGGKRAALETLPETPRPTRPNMKANRTSPRRALSCARLLPPGARRKLCLLGVGLAAVLGARAQSNLSYTITVPNDGSWVAIANQFDQGSNTLDEVLSSVPDGTTLWKWDCAVQDWSSTNYNYIAGVGWDPAGGTLAPGEGALLAA